MLVADGGGEDMGRLLADRLESVRARIAAAARRSGRAPEEIRLMAITKTMPIEMMRAAYSLGLHDFGENRVQEATGKLAEIERDGTLDEDFRTALGPRWGRAGACLSLVGTLQSNKAKLAVPTFDEIHSVDSSRLAGILDEQSRALGRRLPVLLEVNVSGEESKHGFEPDALRSEFANMTSLGSLEIRGLMTIAPLTRDAEDARPVFRRLRLLRDELSREVPGSSLRELSMGMSDDYEVAIEEGATIVRLGRALFGSRG